jgi:uncharacterized protein YjdB
LCSGAVAARSHGEARKRALAVALAFLLVMTLGGGLYPGGSGSEVYANSVMIGQFDLTGDSLSSPGDYSYEDNTLYINSEKPMTVELGTGISVTTDTIYIATDAGIANLTLKDVKIDVSPTTDACAFNVTSGGLNLTLSGENELKSGANRAGLQLNNATLQITGTQTGSLTVIGGAGGAGIGAGSGVDQKAGRIAIQSGHINASSADGAGIGGNSGKADVITISGGEVVANRGGTSGSPDIGGGGSVIIDGGSVWAKNNAIDPAPKNSSSKAVHANVLTLDGVTGTEAIKAGIVDGVVCADTPAPATGVYGLRDVSTDDGEVCLWLPENTSSTTASVVLGTEDGLYGGKYTRDTNPQAETLAPLTLDVTPTTPLDFGTETFGYTDKDTMKKYIVAENKGEIDFKNIAVSSSSPDFVVEPPSTQPVGTLSPGGTPAKFTVYPKTGLAAGEYNATVTMTSMGIPIMTLPLKFIVKHGHKWTVSPSAIDFGVRLPGYSAGAFDMFEYTNTGTGDITNVDIKLTGADEAKFEVRRELPRAIVSPGERRSISLRPNTGLPIGTYTATIELTSSVPEKELPTVKIPVTFTVGSLEITGAKTGDKFTYYASGKGRTKQLKAVIAPLGVSGNKVTWRSSNSSIATVNANGLVTFKGGEGKVKITASVAGFPEAASVTLESRRNVTSFNTPMTKVYLQRGKTMTLPIALTDSTSPNAEVKSKLTWKSSKPSVVKVLQSGKITAAKNVVKTTAATVTVTSANGKSFQFKVAVVPKAVKLKSVTATFPKNIKAGKSYQLAVSLKDAKATGIKLTFKSSKPSVLKVNSAGKLFALKKGSAKITVKAGSKQYVKTVKVK